MAHDPATITQFTHEAYEAALARLRAYSEKVKTVMADAERGSMAAAADMAFVFESKEWVADLPPVRTAHRRGQPVKPDSKARFAQWTEEHPDVIGDVYTRRRISQLLASHEIATEYMRETRVNSETALEPLRSFLKDRRTELPDIVRRVKEITDGGPVTESTVKRAIHDHNQSLIPVKIASSGRKTTTDHAAIIRREFNAILRVKRFRDAGALLNELRAELMAAAGVTDE